MQIQKNKAPTDEQTKRWLTFLAQNLQRDSQTEFLIENLQPTWLLSLNQLRVYKLAVGFTSGMLWGLIFYLSVGLTLLIARVLSMKVGVPSHSYQDDLFPQLISQLASLTKEFLIIVLNLSFIGILGNLLKGVRKSQGWKGSLKNRVINFLVTWVIFAISSSIFDDKIIISAFKDAFVFGIIGLFFDDLNLEIKTSEVIQWSIVKVKDTLTKVVRRCMQYARITSVIGFIFIFISYSRNQFLINFQTFGIYKKHIFSIITNDGSFFYFFISILLIWFILYIYISIFIFVFKVFVRDLKKYFLYHGKIMDLYLVSKIFFHKKLNRFGVVDDIL